MNYYFEYLANRFSRPKTFEGIAKKIVLTIKHFTIKCCIDPKFRSQIGFDKMDENSQSDILREMTVNGICFVVMSFQNLAEISKFPEQSEFYTETAMEIRSYYGNYLKSKNTDLNTVDYWNSNITKRLDVFNGVFQNNKKDLKPMPENNPWVFVSVATMDTYLRGKNMKEKDLLFNLIISWNKKIENESFKILKSALN